MDIPEFLKRPKGEQPDPVTKALAWTKDMTFNDQGTELIPTTIEAATAAKPHHQETTTMSKTTAKKAAKRHPKGGPKAQPARKVKTASANARTPVGERARFDWATAEEKAKAGKVPSHPDFSAATHQRFMPILKEIKEALKSTDKAAAVKTLKSIKINPVSSTPKALDRYRKLCLVALQAEPKAEKPTS